jgi:hypothetical protein
MVISPVLVVAKLCYAEAHVVRQLLEQLRRYGGETLYRVRHFDK